MSINASARNTLPGELQVAGIDTVPASKKLPVKEFLPAAAGEETVFLDRAALGEVL